MDWEALVAIIVPVTFMVTVAGVILLRPISKRLGDLIDVYAKERHEGLQVEVQHFERKVVQRDGPPAGLALAIRIDRNAVNHDAGVTNVKQLCRPV